MATYVLQNPYRASTTGLVSADLDDYVINPMHEHGDMLSGGVAGLPERVAGNTIADTRFLSQTGTGSAAGNPTWAVPTSSQISYDGDEPNVHDKLDSLQTAISVLTSVQGATGTSIQGSQGAASSQAAVSLQGLQGMAGLSGAAVQGIAGTGGLQGTGGLTIQGLAGSGGAQGNYGVQGGTGVTGSIGPGVCFQGYFDASQIYYNNSLRRDIVRYGNDYYLYKGTDATSAAWDINNWETFGATFNSVATEILFANFGYVDNLGVRELEAVGRTVGSLSGTLATTAPDHIDNSPGVIQVETITLTGSEGLANITVGATTHHCLWNESLTQTAADFAAEHGYADLILSSDGPDIIFTALVAGVGFTQPIITNVPQDYRGAVKIQGNDIWENVTEDNTTGGLYINRRSWGGGQGYYRFFRIEDGMGTAIMAVGGRELGSGGNTVVIDAPTVVFNNLPTSDPNVSKQLWSNNGILTIS
jgi:hypothetical protein